MTKTRLIFSLLYDNTNYMLSRNFKLQKVGNLQWVRDNYNLDSILRSIDELIIVNVERENRDFDAFCRNISILLKECFMPVAIGGGINNLECAYKAFDAGAEKLIINTALYENPDFVKQLTKIFGSQAIVASIDYKNQKTPTGEFIQKVYNKNGGNDTGLILSKAFQHIIDLDIGEVYLTCMNKDGTGMGYDIDTIKSASESLPIPIIASGGVGRTDQFSDGIEYGRVNALSTANLFNFMNDGLEEARMQLISDGYQLANWDNTFFRK